MTPADNSYSDHGTRKTHHQVLEQLKEINVIISCITWEHLHLQIPWIEAAKEAGVKRFVPNGSNRRPERSSISKTKVGYKVLHIVSKERLTGHIGKKLET